MGEKNMKVPKIVFKRLSLEDTINNVIWTYFDSEFHDDTVECFKELKNIDSNLPRVKIEKQISDIFTNYYKHNIDDINDNIKRYTLLWDKYNDAYFEAISKYLNIFALIYHAHYDMNQIPNN